MVVVSALRLHGSHALSVPHIDQRYIICGRKLRTTCLPVEIREWSRSGKIDEDSSFTALHDNPPHSLALSAPYFLTVVNGANAATVGDLVSGIATTCPVRLTNLSLQSVPARPSHFFLPLDRFAGCRHRSGRPELQHPRSAPFGRRLRRAPRS